MRKRIEAKTESIGFRCPLSHCNREAEGSTMVVHHLSPFKVGACQGAFKSVKVQKGGIRAQFAPQNGPSRHPA